MAWTSSILPVRTDKEPATAAGLKQLEDSDPEPDSDWEAEDERADAVTFLLEAVVAPAFAGDLVVAAAAGLAPKLRFELNETGPRPRLNL